MHESTRKRISVIDEHFPAQKCMTLTCRELLEVALQTGPAGAKIRPVKPRFYVVGSLTLPAGMGVRCDLKLLGGVLANKRESLKTPSKSRFL